MPYFLKVNDSADLKHHLHAEKILKSFLINSDFFIFNALLYEIMNKKVMSHSIRKTKNSRES